MSGTHTIKCLTHARFEAEATLNEKGCYAGKTYVDGSPGSIPVKVVPDQPLVISYEENVCMTPATFTPQKDGRYRLIATEGHKPSDPDVPFLQSMMHIHDRQCLASVAEVDADGEPVKPIKVKRFDPDRPPSHASNFGNVGDSSRVCGDITKRLWRGTRLASKISRGGRHARGSQGDSGPSSSGGRAPARSPYSPCSVASSSRRRSQSPCCNSLSSEPVRVITDKARCVL